jgi:hypothetical protein
VKSKGGWAFLVQQEEKRKNQAQKTKGPTLNKGNGEIELKKKIKPLERHARLEQEGKKGKKKRKKNKQHAKRGKDLTKRIP